MTYHTLVCHYTATFEDQDIGAREIDVMHKARGWSGIGYHTVIRLDGRIERGRDERRVGAHVKGQNTGLYGLVTVGGLRRSTGAAVGVDTRTPAQIEGQVAAMRDILSRFPTIRRVVGHRDLAATLCPAYSAAEWWSRVEKGFEVPASKPPVTQAVATHPFLKRGSRGQGVITLQTLLAEKGYYRERIDGLFGARTEEAVILFQRHAGLIGPNLGQVGNTTWAALLCS